jgi:hypothetical protein
MLDSFPVEQNYAECIKLRVEARHAVMPVACLVEWGGKPVVSF